MIKIGITGSLSSGKSTVAKIIASKKYPLFDADKSVKKIYQSNVFKAKVFKKFKLKNRSNIKNDLKKKIFENSKKFQNDDFIRLRSGIFRIQECRHQKNMSMDPLGQTLGPHGAPGGPK